MNLLLMEIAGWFGYLQRLEVRVQVILLLLVFFGHGVLSRRLGARLPLAGRRSLVISGLLGLLSLALALAGQPFGLLLLGLLLYLGWLGLGGVRLLLGRFIQPQQMQVLETRLIRPAYLLVAVLLVIRVFDNPQDLALIPIGEWFGSEVTLGSFLLAVLIVYVLAMGTGPPAQGVAWLVQRSVGISNGSRRALALMIRYAAVAVGIVWALDHVGFNRTAILAVAGGLSVGLGFGIKEVFSNFVSGLWLLFEGSVRPGEVLFIDGDPCEVRSLGLRAAVLWRDRDNAELVIPNQTFFTNTTVTYTGTDTLRRSQVLVSAAYHHDPEDVIALLEATARGQNRILATPAPKGLLLRYGDSSIDYALRFWIANPMDNVSICSEVQAAIWRAFRDRQIEIPFPQQVQYQVEGPPKS
ncbi:MULTISPECIES: mechanosensitive ion channel family protein [Cyanophyceae]|jgi:small-conductance mechanosensitive channel|uniref:Mechanosensitive ion channel protein MscS n=1 Tax=Aphanothece cf. minutissima CCALA 015 TaxID=2107695 RepID=A0ABX5FDQ2_9CHRO|nr:MULTISPECIES: mechanosensitive ion channel domain-containing protein [Cyanophyceae]MCP9933625.1 mechanosensitive ion channel [Cyanobium sp. Candia 9D4]PSB39317.1 mechanosensitive ion channel protein MscS [Aphanothece cf. minutissima CCALA 015]